MIGQSDHLAFLLDKRKELIGSVPEICLRNPLMRPCLIEVGHIPFRTRWSCLSCKIEQVIQAFLTNTSQEAFTDGIRLGSLYGVLSILMPLVAATQQTGQISSLSESDTLVCAHTESLLAVVARPTHRLAIVSRPRG